QRPAPYRLQNRDASLFDKAAPLEELQQTYTAGARRFVSRSFEKIGAIVPGQRFHGALQECELAFLPIAAQQIDFVPRPLLGRSHALVLHPHLTAETCEPNQDCCERHNAPRASQPEGSLLQQGAPPVSSKVKIYCQDTQAR